eukprot:CAMPEP_0114549790 /NCGR_PEP_ID=MMETSP0114-20121206/5713_1 /TAXON_ID=31324 /ORGANISM="Goniomonas sp, Strain m" /LENGTH=368 /DNA_ID=CAMNT_0001734491 /DNA_START=8 /DNA_END=1114 /DNA_ORIENTATION=+
MAMEPNKSPFWLSKEDVIQRGVPEGELENYRRTYYQLQHGVDVWYDRVAQHTFPTEFVVLSTLEAGSLSAGCKVTQQNPGSKLRSDQQDALQAVWARIDKAISLFGETGAMVRFTTRSPKDAVMDTRSDSYVQQVRQLVIKDIERTGGLEQYDDAAKINFVLATFVKVCNKMLRVRDAGRAVGLLIKSQRVQQILKKQTAFGSFPRQTALCVRQWSAELAEHPEMELRVFVYNNEITALSQYDTLVHYPNLCEQKETVAERVKKFFYDAVREPLMTHNSYVMDVFVGADKVYIIEFFGFDVAISACLFSWRDNRQQLMSGPFEFRVVEAPLENPLLSLPARWEKVLKEIAFPTEPPSESSGGGAASSS